jgi:Domain of unknown function (DUF4157)
MLFPSSSDREVCEMQRRETRVAQPGSRQRAEPRAQPETGAVRAEARSGAVARVLEAAGTGLLPGGRVHPAVEAAIGRARGGGTSLDSGARERIEPVVGDSLADVRVHSGPDADALARSVQARAFTTGRDVFFARGEYRPGTGAGDRLLAHELTHVVQQRGAPTSGPLTVTEPGDMYEREADRAADGLGG